jgi:drug/metabolite transporter (DMT)-like permease
MQVLLLYLAVVLIWGSTWIVIPFQLGEVAEELSVGYRFGIAAVLLYGYAWLSGRQIRLPADAYLMVFVQGTMLFSLNYFLVYFGTAYITTGLVSVVFSCIVLFNAIFERVFFRSPFEAPVLVAAAIGFSGIALIFWPEITVLSFTDDAVIGVSLVLGATIVASLGNMAAIVNTRRTLPVMAVNAHAMAWAAITSIIIALALGRELTFSTRPGYVVSLLYLALFGSAIAFGCYLALIRRIGAAKAAYSTVVVPIIALLLSTLFEGYTWTAAALVGIILTLIGNWLILMRPAKKITTPQV